MKKDMCSECNRSYDEGMEDEAMEAKGSKSKNRNKKIEIDMHEFSEGSLRSGSKKGPKVKSKAKALAIGYSEAKKANKKKKK